VTTSLPSWQGDPQDREKAERELIARLRAGDRAAFDSIVRQHTAALVRFAYGYAKNQAAAEDVVQDALFRLWSDRATIEIHVSLKAWLYVAVRSLVLNHLRRSHLEERVAAASWAEPLAMSQPPTPPDEILDRQHRIGAVRRAIAAVPALYRRTLALRFTEGLSHREIASVLGIPVKTVETRVTRGLRIVKQHLLG
jgi:RNA polymerase sigma-70 factor (family 1)